VSFAWASTRSTAGWLETEPNAFVIVTQYVPLSLGAALLILRVFVVAPEIGRTQFAIHWYPKGPVPTAVTLKTTGWPCKTVRLWGGEVITGNWARVNFALELVTLPRLLATTTE
jgi:hypothetical protein